MLLPAAAAAAMALAYPGGSEAFRKECRRKLFHQGIFLYLGAYFILGHPAFAWWMAGWTLLVGVGETLRLKAAWAKPFFDRLFSGIIREKEARRFSGTFYVALGLVLTAFINGSDPALMTAGVLYLSLGDAVSPLVGLRFGVGRYTVFGTLRSVDGTLAGFAVAFLVGVATGFSPWASLGAAAAFSFVDTFPVRPDDNFWIPLVGSTALRLLSR